MPSASAALAVIGIGAPYANVALGAGLVIATVGGWLPWRRAAEEHAADDRVVAGEPGDADADVAGDGPHEILAAGESADRLAVEQRVGRGVEDLEALAAHHLVVVEAVERNRVRLAVGEADIEIELRPRIPRGRQAPGRDGAPQRAGFARSTPFQTQAVAPDGVSVA